MPAVEVAHATKSYADRIAVDDLSFSVEEQEIFGLIGPNGAGKTSTIRMMMDIIKPDSGEIRLFGERLTESSKKRLGYLPEERGLYKKLSVVESIEYLASLKGMDSRTALSRAEELLARTGMLAHKGKKIDELSKGMGQLIQFVVTIVHDPELVVLDEPFAGLDPAHTAVLKELLLELRNSGKTIVLSTHQMNQVEELCDRVLMINNGRSVLYGDLARIKASYRGNSVIVDANGDLGDVPGVLEIRPKRDHVELTLAQDSSPDELLKRLVDQGKKINRYEVATPSLDEIFLDIVRKDDE